MGKCPPKAKWISGRGNGEYVIRSIGKVVIATAPDRFAHFVFDAINEKIAREKGADDAK